MKTTEKLFRQKFAKKIGAARQLKNGTVKASEERFCQKYAKNIRHCAVIKNGTAKANEKLLCRKFAKKVFLLHYSSIVLATQHRIFVREFSEKKGVHSLLPFQLGLPRSAECFSRIFGKKRFCVRFRHSIFCCRAGPNFFREFSIKRFSFAFTVPFFVAAQCRFFSIIFEQKKKVFRLL